jgi:hypothetical protein
MGVFSGKLYHWYYAQCATCEYEEPVGEVTRTRAIARLQKMGWKKTKQGYVCSDCSKEQKEK